jgi:hypothetical protein
MTEDFSEGVSVYKGSRRQELTQSLLGNAGLSRLYRTPDVRFCLGWAA